MKFKSFITIAPDQMNLEKAWQFLISCGSPSRSWLSEFDRMSSQNKKKFLDVIFEIFCLLSGQKLRTDHEIQVIYYYHT